VSTRSWILAIDFGTSYTVAAALVEGRAPEVVEIEGNRRVPSVVLVEGDTFVVGKLADELSASYPGRTLRAPKRRIGDSSPIVLDGRPHQVVELIAALLRHVYHEAVRQFGSPPSQVRLTHPAVWVRPQMNRLLEAAAMAGLPHAVLVPEPVAAALAYAAEVGVPVGAHVAVYDLGGGTFDTAVVTPSDAGFQIVGRPGGDSGIGGELFDELLTEHVGNQLDPTTWQHIQFSDEPMWRRLAANLRAEVRRGKEMLSGYPVAEILVPVPGELVQVRVTREEYEGLIADHIEATLDIMERCVRDAGTDPARLAAVYLVGGASRTPLITRLLEQRFGGVPISRRGDPKTSTAVGAALAVRSTELGAAVARGVPTPPPTPIAAPPVARPASVPPLPPPPITPAPTGVVGLGGAPTQPTPVVATAPVATTTRVTAPARGAGHTLVQPTPLRKKRRAIWWVLALLLIAGGGAAAAVLLISGADDASSPDTSPATTTRGTATSTAGFGSLDNQARCVREDIDFAALREGPGKTRMQVSRIPAGTCGVIATERVKGDGGGAWLKVTWTSFEGYSIESNFLPATTDPTTVTTAGPTSATTAPAVTTFTVPSGLLPPDEVVGFAELIDQYFTLVTSGDLVGGWARLSPSGQASFGSQATFDNIWANITGVEVVTFSGCTNASAPTSCYFTATYANAKGGASATQVRFDFVDIGGTPLIDASQLDVVGCITNNPGESGCRAN